MSFKEDLEELKRELLAASDKFRQKYPNCILKIEHWEIERHNFGGKPYSDDVIKVSANPSQFEEA